VRASAGQVAVNHGRIGNNVRPGLASLTKLTRINAVSDSRSGKRTHGYDEASDYEPREQCTHPNWQHSQNTYVGANST
jgi:hypothetical protein